LQEKVEAEAFGDAFKYIDRDSSKESTNGFSDGSSKNHGKTKGGKACHH